MNHMAHQDIFIRITDPSGKQKSIVNHHRVWDVERFLAAQQEQYNGPKVKPEDRRHVRIAMKAEYDEQRKAVRA